MEIKVDIGKKLAHFDLDVSFEARSGEITVLIGPSGSGKTTLMRMIAGLERPDMGQISFGGAVWVDRATGVFVPPQKRCLGYVFQEYNLFPHLSVRRNVAFAARDRKTVQELMDLFGVSHLAGKRPHAISGGERQRTAICQVLARGPQALLMDEPFSSLDQPTRRRLQKELKAFSIRSKMPIIHITHDLSEAVFLGDRILSLVEGHLAPEWLDRQLEDLLEDRECAVKYRPGA